MSGGKRHHIDNDKRARTWEFTTRLDRSGYPTVVPIQSLHYPPHVEFDDRHGVHVPPPPVTTPRGERSDSDDELHQYERRLTVTPRQIVNRMNMLEAFSDAVSRTFRPHADTINHPPPNPDSTFAAYVPFAFDFDVVPDPQFAKHGWVNKVSDYLFYASAYGHLLTAAILSLTFFATFILSDIYARQMLRMILEEGSYVNIYVFIGSHFLLHWFLIVFLCYPNRESWGRLHKMRWIPLGMVNIVLIVGVLDQFYWLANFNDMGRQLKELMEEGLDVTQMTTLTTITQVYFQCCGVDGYHDWDSILNENRTIYYGGYPKSCCSDTYVKACSIPVNETIILEPSLTTFNQLWPTGCYDYELYIIHVTIILIWLGLLVISFTSVVESLVLWWVIRHINIHEISTDHPFGN